MTSTDAPVLDDWEEDAYAGRLEDAGIDESGQPTDDADADADADAAGDSNAGRFVGYVETDYGTEVDKHAWDTLFDYQREGVRWMYDLYQRGVGGILGDEMGLGKVQPTACLEHTYCASPPPDYPLPFLCT